MIKAFYIILVLNFGFISNCKCQILKEGWKKSILLFEIESNNNFIPIGTGFIVKSKGTDFFVTNNHIAIEKNLFIRFNTKNNGLTKIRYSIEKSKSENKIDWLVNKEFDNVYDKILLLYGKDGFQNERIATHGFLHRNWIDTIGYVQPPFLGVAFIDDWITNVAQSVGRKKYLETLEFEHLHPAAGKSEWNQTYLDKMDAGHERDIYNNLSGRVQEDINKLNNFIENFKNE